MLSLIANVINDPLQIFRSKAHDTVSCLPIKKLAVDQLMIHIMRTRAFELPNPISDYQCRRNTDDNVNVRFGPADFMKDDSLAWSA